jgi:hypothetical protein
MAEWARDIVTAVLFMLSAFCAAMGVDSIIGGHPSRTGYVLCGLLFAIGVAWLAPRIHASTRRKEDR